MTTSVEGGSTMAANITNHTNLVNMSIKFFSDVLGKLRAFDGIMDQNTQHALGGVDFDSLNAYIGQNSHPPPTFVSLPGPWRFMTSAYAIALMAMAILLNRIQNIVVPPRNHLNHHRVSRNSRNSQTSTLRWLYYSILPIDFSSTFSRFIFRIPSLFFLSKALLLWTVTLLQTSELFPSWQWNWLIRLGIWVGQKDMEDICWFSFCAVCGALCVGAITRGLEGPSADASTSTSPFNLFGYAFFLHIYSSPMTHATKLDGMASRPDKHVVFTMMMPLFQLSMIHTLGVKRRWSRQRLIPTAITSILSLVHFHIVLWFSPSSYPLLNYMPCLFESGLVLVTLLAIGLNALTQLLLEGSVTRPLFGHQATLLPKWDEDFATVILRLGTASLEATSVAGLGNEVGGVNVSNTTDVDKTHTEYGLVEINRFGIISITNTTEGRGRRKRLREGFANEIKHVKAGTAEGELWIDAAWYRELVRFGVGLARFVKGLGRLVWNGLRGKIRVSDLVPPASTAEEANISQRRVVDESEESDGQDDYARFVRGENVSDDDDDEFDLSRVSRNASTGSTPSTPSEYDEGAETVGLYADLSSAASTSTSAPLLLAHMTDTSSSPLTRRRYSHLVSGGGSRSPETQGIFDDWSTLLGNRRVEDDDGLGDTRRNCVICTVEPRQIICWPCRCLALCDDCRENLASRSSAAKHTCPCCRRSVEGYSKIFIP